MVGNCPTKKVALDVKCSLPRTAKAFLGQGWNFTWDGRTRQPTTEGGLPGRGVVCKGGVDGVFRGFQTP